jgi:hypothetical protein
VSDGGTCGCGARWTGRRTAHCAACHRTFGGVGGFDRHRRGGACLEPADVGLELRGGVFRGPELTVEMLERLARY